ncbi:MAG: polyprenol phosphomannose-dependent alpha 1,6 mannosyltransferase MptB [Acidimicrobiaceae bacterium]|nr:polyprenol phosphomannose-dependent alpha 1,6 mannosyltransferase MptB [Acidimicrobiaceae bacterium]
MLAVVTSKNGKDQDDHYAALASKRSFSNVFRVFGRHMVLGFVSSLLVALGSLQQLSPFTSKVPGSWWIGIAQPGTVPSSRFESPMEIMVIVALGVGIIVWFDLLRTVRRHPNIPLSAFWYIGAAWILPLAIAGPLFSKDIYSYAALGEMVSHHISPYKYGPNVLGGTSYLNTVDPFWGNAKTPYGPFFVGLAAFITTITMHHAFATMIGLRILALVSAIGIGVYVPRLAGSFGFDKGTAFTLAVLNPVTIYHLISAGHNDVLMLALLLAGLYYARVSRPVLGVVLVTLAALVKVPAEIGVLYIGWRWLGEERPFKDRIRPVVSAFLISGIVMELAAKITGLGWGWILALSTPGAVRSPAVPATALASWLHDMSQLVGLSFGLGSFLTVTRLLGFVISGLGSLYFLYHSQHYGSLKAIGYTFLVVTLFAPVIQPWYIAWGLIMLAVAPSNRVTWGIVSVSVAAMVLGLPGGPPIIALIFYILVVLLAVFYLSLQFKIISRDRFLPLVNRYFGLVQSA